MNNLCISTKGYTNELPRIQEAHDQDGDDRRFG